MRARSGRYGAGAGLFELSDCSNVMVENIRPRNGNQIQNDDGREELNRAADRIEMTAVPLRYANSGDPYQLVKYLQKHERQHP